MCAASLHPLGSLQLPTERMARRDPKKSTHGCRKATDTAPFAAMHGTARHTASGSLTLANTLFSAFGRCCKAHLVGVSLRHAEHENSQRPEPNSLSLCLASQQLGHGPAQL